MKTKAQLLLPPVPLASCVAAGIYRDTLGIELNDCDRLNYFPASPMVSITRVFDGQLHMHSGLTEIGTLRAQKPIKPVTVIAPQDMPTSSWSPGPVRALTIGIYPEAWKALETQGETDALAELLMGKAEHISAFWDEICEQFLPLWEEVRSRQSSLFQWYGTARVMDWSRHILTQAAFSGPGKSLRSIERRLRNWTGHSKQQIDFFAKVENLHAISTQNRDVSLAEVALEAGCSDQSHMGRMVRRATGFSPGDFNKRVESEEAFWCYRLLGERF